MASLRAPNVSTEGLGRTTNCPLQRPPHALTLYMWQRGHTVEGRSS